MRYFVLSPASIHSFTSGARIVGMDVAATTTVHTSTKCDTTDCAGTRGRPMTVTVIKYRTCNARTRPVRKHADADHVGIEPQQATANLVKRKVVVAELCLHRLKQARGYEDERENSNCKEEDLLVECERGRQPYDAHNPQGAEDTEHPVCRRRSRSHQCTSR